MLVPESGDTVQAMKAGILEIADIFVVNKADRDGAGQLVTALSAMVSLAHGPHDMPPPVLTTEAHRGVGVPELYQRVSDGVEASRASGRLAERRNRGARQEVTRLVTTEVTGAVDRVMEEDDRVSGHCEECRVRPPRPILRRSADSEGRADLRRLEQITSLN